MKTLKQIEAGLVAATVALALAIPAFAAGKDGQEEKVKLEDCPAAVQKTIRDNAGTGEILEIEKETKKDGTVIYEAEVKKADGRKVDIKVAADGTLIGVEDDDEEQDNDDKKANN